MIQRDYINRKQQLAPTRCKRIINLRKKQCYLPTVSSIMMVIGAIILIKFISDLYLIIINDNMPDVTKLQCKKISTNSLPLKPKNRWKYVKELENRQPSVNMKIEQLRSIKNNIHYNGKQCKNQVQSKQWQQIEPIQQSKTEIIMHSNSIIEKKVVKITSESKDQFHWMIQCGSFKETYLADTIRAQLAFEGYNSHITNNNGWNNVIIGPIKSKQHAVNVINHLKITGYSNCIKLTLFGGLKQ